MLCSFGRSRRVGRAKGRVKDKLRKEQLARCTNVYTFALRLLRDSHPFDYLEGSKKMGCLKLPYYEKRERLNFLGLWKKNDGSKSGEDYYPFGLKFNSYSRENSVPNKTKLFQGQEHIDDLGLDWDSFKWRNYQPEIGRFFNIDPLAEKYVHNSLYAFSENKIITFKELEGQEPEVSEAGVSIKLHGKLTINVRAKVVEHETGVGPTTNTQLRFPGWIFSFSYDKEKLENNDPRWMPSQNPEFDNNQQDNLSATFQIQTVTSKYTRIRRELSDFEKQEQHKREMANYQKRADQIMEDFKKKMEAILKAKPNLSFRKQQTPQNLPAGGGTGVENPKEKTKKKGALGQNQNQQIGSQTQSDGFNDKIDNIVRNVIIIGGF